MNSSLNDKFLVAASQAGDEEAFGKLYDKYSQLIYRFIVLRLNSREDANDLTSEVFLKAWQYLVTGKKNIDNFKAWLYRLAGNLVIDHYRQSGRELQVLDEGQWNKIIDETYNLEAQIKQKEDARWLRQAMEKLSQDERELLVMRYIDDLDIKEISAILDKTTGAVRVALHRAIKALKEVI